MFFINWIMFTGASNIFFKNLIQYSKVHNSKSMFGITAYMSESRW
jgi:hypothetical protein